MIVAIAHILGVVITQTVLGFLKIWLAAWEQERNSKKTRLVLSMDLDIPLEELDEPEHDKALLEWAAERHSTEKLVNRLADVVGILLTIWNTLGSIVQAGIILAAAWFAFTEDLDNAVFAWVAPVLGILLFIVHYVVAVVCYILTGRYPGQARSSRKIIAEGVAQ